MVQFAFLLSLFLVPTFVFAANNDPFRGGREAVSPKQSAGVGESTGAMTYSYPLTIPPGRNGVQPSLSLSYSSDDKRQDSIFGYGWSMSIPYIEHTNKLGTNNLYNNLYSQDRSHTFFTSSLSGELLPALNSTAAGGSFLGFMQGLSALALLDLPEDDSLPNSTAESSPTASEQSTAPTNTTSVDSETARSFHTFPDTFSPTYVYHPNREAEWNAARLEGAKAAKVPIPGFPIAEQKRPPMFSVIPSPLTPTLENLSIQDQATLKGEAIAQLGSIARVRHGDYFIEVESFNPIDGGVEIFVKAWDANGTPIGFGTDGTVEIERIRSFNPPILVGDPQGDIVTNQTNPATATTSETVIEVARYREDLKEATLRDLEHTLSVKKEMFGPERIVGGKVGRTTDTFRSAAGANDPTDCTVYRNGANESFANIRSNAGTGVDSGNPVLCDSTNLSIYFGSSATTDQYEYLYRGVTIFDTSAIDANDTVSSATFSIKSVGSWDEAGSGVPDLALFWATSTSNSSLATGDYANNVPSGSLGSVTAATLNSNGHGSDPSLATFNDVTLSSVTNINKGSGARTKIGIGNAWDVNNNLSAGSNAHSWVSGKNSWFGLWSADITGTTNDPKLVVEHAVTVPSAPTNLYVDDATNPSNIATSSPYFSAIHANASTTALATSYQIQIDTQGTFTTPYWDSGKKTLASSTPSAMRTPQIFSTTTFALDGTKYYWRIRFWDQIEGQGPWSTSGDYFIMQVAGDYMAKVDDGSFMRYTLDTDGVWIAYDKRGWKYTFGATTNARINDPATTSMIYRWYLEEIADTNGNKVIYHYLKDGGQVYPTSIDYTDYGGSSLFQIAFATSSRGASAGFATSSVYGFPVLTRYNVSDITAKVNGTVVRRYTPTYTTGDNQSRSLLASVQETGYRDNDGSGALTFPATTFNYQTSTTTWTQVTDANGYQVDFDVSDTSNNDYGWRLFDVNGDALPDWVKSDGSSQTVLLNTGSKWATSTAWTVPVAFSASNIEQGVRMADVNGDGLVDIIAATSTKVVYINNGTSTWMASSTWAFPESFIDSGNRDQGVQLVDLNGDNMADVLRSHYASTTGTTTAVYTNSGHGWAQDTGWSIPEVLVSDLHDSAVRLYDYSGDGLVDIVYSPYLSTTTRAYVNNGRGWTIDSSFVSPFPFASTTASIGSADLGVRFADFNGDGCVDVARAFATDPSEVRLASCTSATSPQTISNTLPEAFRGATSTAYDYGVRMADINGDGQLDIVRSFYDSGGGTRTRKVYLKNGNTPDMLKEVVNGRGGRTTTTYKGSAQYQDGGGNLLNPNLPFVTQTVRTLTTDSGSFLPTGRVIATTTYDYQRGYFYGTSTDPLLRQFAGFGLVTATSAANAVTKTYFHQGNGGSDASNGEFGDHISKAGKPYRVEIFDQSGNLFSRTINKWGRADFGDGRNFVKLGQTLTQTFDGDGTHRDTAASTTYSDTTGNLALLVNYGEVSGNSDGTFSDIGTDLASTTYTYAASSTLSAMSLPARELLVDQNGTTVKDTKWYYDSLANGSVSFGNQTKQENLISGSTYASTTRTYDVYGNVATSSDPLGNRTGFVYDGYNLFPTTVRNALNQEKLLSYDYSQGKAATTTDENNQTVATDYDNLDRPIVEKQPDFATPSTLVTKTTYAYTDNTNTPSSVFRSDYLSTATTTDSYTFLDGFDRTIQTKREAEAANGWITKDIIYNAIGKVGQESLPYFSSSVSSGTTAKILVVAGGGGGGDGSDNFGGGGGAGEVVYNSSVTLTAGAKTITVGGGGAGGTGGNGDDGDNGNDSYYDQGGAAQILADGGGGGAALLNRPGKNGGSGGGGSASSNTTTGGSETADGFGNNGGAVTNNVNGGTGGGGGAGGAGTDGSLIAPTGNQNGGLGGAGIADASIGGLLAMTSSGVGGYIGGGGGGGSATGGVAGTGGSGGGGNGSENDIIGTVGTANTGGGGGGGGGANGGGEDNGMDGGSGLVLVVYTTANFTHTGGNSTGTSVSETWVKFTANGTLTLTGTSGTAPSYTTPTTTAALFVTNTYDALGRVLTTANAVGTTTNAYSDWRLTVTDPLSNKKDFNKDAYGNLASVVEYPSAGATTTYTWNLLNKLTKITDASANIRNFTYDNLGRLTGSEDLHAGGDTTFGTTSRQYDLAGNLIQVYTPQGTAVDYTYDALNRVLTENSTTTSSLTDITYRYDTCTNGKGRLCEVNANNAATTTYAYNPLGLVGTTSKQIGTTWATTTTSYLRNGAQEMLTYPEGHQIAYVYNDAGDINRMLGRATTTWWALIESTNYGPTGQPTFVDYGNNTQTTYTYDAAHLYRLTRKLTVSTSTNPGTTEQLLFLGSIFNAQKLKLLAQLDEPLEPLNTEATTTTLTEVPEIPNIETDTVVTTASTSPDLTLIDIVPTETVASWASVSPDLSSLDVNTLISETTITPPIEASSSPQTDTTTIVPLLDLNIGTTSTPTTPEVFFATSTHPVTDAIANFAHHDQSTLKGQAIAELGTISKVRRGKYWIEVASMEPIDGGVQMFVKAWDADGNPIGFGTDGTVEIERIRSFNPPILVGDPAGDVVTTQTDPATATTTEKIVEIARYREDLKEATLRDLEHTISVKKELFGPEHIITGKVGRTTDTFRSLAGSNDPADGPVSRDLVNESFASIRSGNGTTVNDSHDSPQLNLITSGTADQYAYMSRGVAIFDTSAISSNDTVSAATFSYKSSGSHEESGSGKPDAHLFWAASASNSALAASDYQSNVPSASLGSVTATTINANAGSPASAATFNDITLNSVTNVNKGTSARTKIGLGTGWDVQNTLSGHTWVANKNSFTYWYTADNTGTADDPKLVVEHSVPAPPAASGALQDLNYGYDAVGNITLIADHSNSNAYAHTFYTYDNLYRLTSASTTNATTTNWIQTYTYNDLGNITSKSDVGSYTYAGTGWANPHAPTTINGTTYGYDAAGNLTSAGASAYTWNYRNRLTDTNINSTTTHYLYDFNDQRVQQDVKIGAGATSTTRYWSKIFETKGATTTLYVFLPNGELLATVEGNGSATSTYIAHTDHQGSTNVMSDKNGTLAQLATYYPFGAKRNNELPSNGFRESRLFISQYDDLATNLNYLNARYYDATRGQFISEDPMVKRMGYDNNATQRLIIDPQQQNYYSYARNNPVNLSDPSGEAFTVAQTSAITTVARLVTIGAISSGVGVAILLLILTPVITPSIIQTASYLINGSGGAPTSVVSKSGGGGGSVSAPVIPSQTAMSTSQVMPGAVTPWNPYNFSKKDAESKKTDKPEGWRDAPSNPWESPGEGWEPRPGSIKDPNQRPYKDWYKPETKETMHPDFDHPGPIGPHWDLKGPGGQFRVPPGGGIPTPK